MAISAVIQTLADIARTHARERAHKTAFIYGDRRISFGDLNERSNRVANGLRAAGVGARDRVAFLDKNSPEFFEILFGASKLNAVTVPVNWRLAPDEAAYIVNDSEAKVLVIGGEFLPLLTAMRPKLTLVREVLVAGGTWPEDSFNYEGWLSAQSDVDPGTALASDDVALQLYSSGTTGVPKGAMLTNANCAAFLAGMLSLLSVGADSVSLVAMPLFHVAGGLWALFGFHAGLTSVLEREVNPARLIQVIERHRVTHAVLVPAVLQFMVQLPGAENADFSSLEYMLYGASPISEEILRASMRTFDCKFLQIYGMTETTAGTVALRPEDHDPDGPGSHRLRAAGKPIADYGVRISDPESGMDLPVGEVGEILVQSPQNMKGYWKLPEETARTLLAGGWLRTGDAGYLDGDGYLFIHDRVKDMIISGGENVYPAEVENALMAHPGVADVAVIGVPSEQWGETPRAFVVRAAGSDVAEEELMEFARARLARYKCPSSIEWRDTLPRNATGKLLKKDLRAPYWEGRERQVN